MPENWRHQRRNVFVGHVVALAHQRAALGRQNNELHTADAGAEVNILLHEIRRARVCRACGADNVHRVSSYGVRNGHHTNQLLEIENFLSRGDGRSSTLIKKLATLQEEAGKKKEASASLARLNYIYPFDEELHRRLGSLWLEQGNIKGAVAEFAAVIASKPLDQAASHFNLARALKSDNRTEDAKEQLLLALEAAPGYKPAQHLLLEMSGK